MSNNVLSIQAYEELLNTEAYHYQVSPREHIEEFEKNNSWTTEEVFSLYGTMASESGVPPTHEQYLEEAVKQTKAFWFKGNSSGKLAKYTKTPTGWETTYLTWTDRMERAIRWRLSRMYVSQVVEYSAICTINSLYPQTIIMSGSALDLTMGVDIVVVSQVTGKTFFVHVTKDSKWAMQSIERKGKIKTWRKDSNKKKHTWQRSYTDTHTTFLYDTYPTDSSKIINGNAVLKPEYIQAECEKMLQRDLEVYNPQSELGRFHSFLLQGNMVPGGINSMIISYTLTKNKK